MNHHEIPKGMNSRPICSLFMKSEITKNDNGGNFKTSIAQVYVY